MSIAMPQCDTPLVTHWIVSSLKIAKKKQIQTPSSGTIPFCPKNEIFKPTNIPILLNIEKKK